jgi:hypothetical protein
VCHGAVSLQMLFQIRWQCVETSNSVLLPRAARYLLQRLRYDEAQARILCCDIKGGTECVRCCDGSRLVIEACTLSAFRVVRLLHASIGRLLWRGVG